MHFWILLIQFHYCFRSLTVGCASHAGRPADDLSAINRYFLDLATPWFIEYFDLIDLLLCSMLPATSSSDCLRTRLMVIHLNPGPPKLWKEHFPQSHFLKLALREKNCTVSCSIISTHSFRSQSLSVVKVLSDIVFP